MHEKPMHVGSDEEVEFKSFDEEDDSKAFEEK